MLQQEYPCSLNKEKACITNVNIWVDRRSTSGLRKVLLSALFIILVTEQERRQFLLIDSTFCTISFQRINFPFIWKRLSSNFRDTQHDLCDCKCKSLLLTGCVHNYGHWIWTQNVPWASLFRFFRTNFPCKLSVSIYVNIYSSDFIPSP